MTQRFKLLRGTHVQIDPKTAVTRTYREGDLIDSPQDLRCYNGQGVPLQFELIHPHQEQYPSPAEDHARQQQQQVARTEGTVTDTAQSKPQGQPQGQPQGKGK